MLEHYNLPLFFQVYTQYNIQVTNILVIQTEHRKHFEHTANIEQRPLLYNPFLVLSRLKLNPPVIRFPPNLHLPLLIKQNLESEIKKKRDCSFHHTASSGQAISEKVAEPNVLYTVIMKTILQHMLVKWLKYLGAGKLHTFKTQTQGHSLF